MARASEVIIIGAGIVGCSISYHLAKMGCRDVVVLEKNRIGSGSTENCAGGIRQQFSTEVNIRLSIESVKFFENFEEETGYPADFRQYGYLMLATTQEDLETFRLNIALQKKLGVRVDLLSTQEAKEVLPLLNVDDVLGATYCSTDGYADPYSVVQGFAAAAKRLDVRIYEETEVTGIQLQGSRVKGVSTTRGNFDAPVVINASGPYAAQVGKTAGLDIPIRPLSRTIFITPSVEGIASGTPMVVDFHSGFWFRKEGPSLIFGMRNPDQPEGLDARVDWEFLTGALAGVASNRLPLLNEYGITRARAGLHSDTPDYHAILGKAPHIEGLYLACGFSGHGFMHSPVVGRLIAQLVLCGKPDIDISSLSLDRFNDQVCEKERCFI